MFMDRFSTTVGRAALEKDPDAIVKIAYGNFVREPLRTFARDEVQRRNGLEVKDALDHRSATPCSRAFSATPPTARS